MAKKRFNPHDVGGFGLDVDICPVSMRDEFSGAPPFTVLDARTADWQNRKKAWTSIGLDSELGRGSNLLKMSTTSIGILADQEIKDMHDAVGHAQRRGNQDLLFKNQNRLNTLMASRGFQRKDKEGNLITVAPKEGEQPQGKIGVVTGTSIFDPVLCELAYNWWAPKNGTVLDPFCGGSVRGIVSAMLGHPYTGIDLRQEQIDANNYQWDTVSQKPYVDGKPKPNWLVGDSMNIRALAGGQQYDMVFSCPPYGNLEKYSKLENDISNMSYADFLTCYRHIIRRACSMLKPNRFAVFVIGEFREKETGSYVNFVGDTIQAFLDAGMAYYNEAILVTMVGSLPIRAGAHFRKSRKLGKTHQNVLCFWKGDPSEVDTIIASDFGGTYGKEASGDGQE